MLKKDINQLKINKLKSEISNDLIQIIILGICILIMYYFYIGNDINHEKLKDLEYYNENNKIETISNTNDNSEIIKIGREYDVSFFCIYKLDSYPMFGFSEHDIIKTLKEKPFIKGNTFLLTYKGKTEFIVNPQLIRNGKIYKTIDDLESVKNKVIELKIFNVHIVKDNGEKRIGKSLHIILKD